MPVYQNLRDSDRFGEVPFLQSI